MAEWKPRAQPIKTPTRKPPTSSASGDVNVPGLDSFGRFINRRDLDALRPVLKPNERVLYALEAFHDKQGLLAATDKRILFVRAGLLASRVSTFAYADVLRVRVDLDIDEATVTIVTKTGDIVFAKCKKRLAEAFGEAVMNRPPAPGALLDFSPGPKGAKAARLERLDRMFARGTMTKGEYERSRRAIVQGD